MVKEGESLKVLSNQDGLHTGLIPKLLRQSRVQFKRPRKTRTSELFDRISDVRPESLILDLGCGVGDSSFYLARSFPTSLVIGIDKSAERVRKAQEKSPDGFQGILEREDYEDFLLEALRRNVQFMYTAIYYPNPWPKKSHLSKRIYASPIFPIVLQLSQRLELRTNWALFAQEFALNLYSAEAKC